MLTEQEEKLENYRKMTHFIDQMSRKKEMAPVWDTENRKMKKHRGWNKVMMGIKKDAATTPGSPLELAHPNMRYGSSINRYVASPLNH